LAGAAAARVAMASPSTTRWRGRIGTSRSRRPPLQGPSGKHAHLRPGGTVDCLTGQMSAS